MTAPAAMLTARVPTLTATTATHWPPRRPRVAGCTSAPMVTPSTACAATDSRAGTRGACPSSAIAVATTRPANSSAAGDPEKREGSR